MNASLCSPSRLSRGANKGGVACPERSRRALVGVQSAGDTKRRKQLFRHAVDISGWRTASAVHLARNNRAVSAAEVSVDSLVHETADEALAVDYPSPKSLIPGPTPPT